MEFFKVNTRNNVSGARQDDKFIFYARDIYLNNLWKGFIEFHWFLRDFQVFSLTKSFFLLLTFFTLHFTSSGHFLIFAKSIKMKWSRLSLEKIVWKIQIEICTHHLQYVFSIFTSIEICLFLFWRVCFILEYLWK